METENQKLQRQIDELKREFNLLKNASTIPFNIDGAFSKRLELDSLTKITPSSKDPDSEDVIINEGGSDTKRALNDPIGFVRIVGTDYYLPYFNA